MTPLGMLARLLRDLGALLTLGHPLLEALGRVRLRARGHEARLLQVLEEHVRGGDSLARALQGCPVPQTLKRAVQALQQTADLLESTEWRHLGVRSALAYPRFVVVAGLVLGLVLALVLPTLFGGLAHLDQELPLATRLGISLGQWLSSPMVLVLMVAGMLGIDALLAGRWGLDSWRLRLPVLGAWLRRQETVTCLEWLDHLLTRGLPLDEALRISAGAASSPAFAGELECLAGEVAQGSTLAEATALRVFPGTAAWLVTQAESREFPPGVLTRMARTLQREVDLTANRGLALVEPLALLAVGGLLGALVLAWFLPLYQLIGAMG
jgi:type II secretory pathway component PulF